MPEISGGSCVETRLVVRADELDASPAATAATAPWRPAHLSHSSETGKGLGSCSNSMCLVPSTARTPSSKRHTSRAPEPPSRPSTQRSSPAPSSQLDQTPTHLFLEHFDRLLDPPRTSTPTRASPAPRQVRLVAAPDADDLAVGVVHRAVDLPYSDSDCSSRGRAGGGWEG